MAEAKFKVGQVVMHDRQGKRSLPALILEVIEPQDIGGSFYYRTDRRNCFAESLFRALNPEETGNGRLALATPVPQSAATLEHTRSCPEASLLSEELCTCGLDWRIALQTEQTMHAAWRKRAEEAEMKLARFRARHIPSGQSSESKSVDKNAS